jgi:HD-GYP domain-containing protein (c-di-GMP phosphodiesterase class II)
MFREADNKMYQNKLLKKESIRSTFVKTFMKALEAKDFISEGHVIRMENYAILIAKALSLRQDQMDSIILLTKFHDIGKIGIPDRILKKPGSLNDDEWKVMRTHSAIGERIALEAAEIKDIAHLILKHHEKWDGTGYPLGLSGEDIPLECRVLAIVDTFDAMTNDRPYRKAIPVAETVKEIIRCKGTQFDPYLVDVFLQILKETGISL